MAFSNLFLIRWLATALKQHRFSCDVTPDIEWLPKQGRQLGVSAKLVLDQHYTVATAMNVGNDTMDKHEENRLIFRITPNKVTTIPVGISDSYSGVIRLSNA